MHIIIIFRLRSIISKCTSQPELKPKKVQNDQIKPDSDPFRYRVSDFLNSAKIYNSDPQFKG